MKSVILVAFGGRSTEHDVSVITGVMALNALKKAGEEVLPLFITPNGEWQTAAWMFDVSAFSQNTQKKTQTPLLLAGSDVLYFKKKNKLIPYAYVRAAVCCLHGKNGEDGTFSAQMKQYKIPVTCPEMTESALFMDKWYAKNIVRRLGVETLPDRCILREEFLKNAELCVSAAEKEFSYPLCVKPARLGSSIGVSIVKNGEEFAKALSLVFRYDLRAIVEPALEEFTEYSVAVYRKEGQTVLSAPQRQEVKGEFFTFAEKYLKNAAYLGENKADQPVSSRTENALLAAARRVYDALLFCGVVRFDFLVKEGRIYLNEVNTVPGSLSYYFFADDPARSGGFLRELVDEGIRTFREEESLLSSFASPVLRKTGGGKGKGKRV